MFENYEYENLLIGNLVTLTNMGYGPQNIEEGPFIFYKKNNETNRCIEVFTEEEYMVKDKPSSSTGGRRYKILENEENAFGKTYVKVTDEIKNYLTEEEKEKLNLEINRVKLLKDQNQEAKINFSINKKRILEIYRTMLNKLAIERENEAKEREEKAKLIQEEVLKEQAELRRIEEEKLEQKYKQMHNFR